MQTKTHFRRFRAEVVRRQRVMSQPMGKLRENLLSREQWIDSSLENVFAFFSEAQNLDRITPPWMNFKILRAPAGITEGVLIDYKLGWRGIPMRWTTRIEEWRPPFRFVDLQLRGPYRLWHHTHSFEAKDGGTLMRDTLRYAVPMGSLGHVLAGARVRADVERIFDYRSQQIRQIFGS